MFFLHSIRTRIKTGIRMVSSNVITSSFFIPLEQGLKPKGSSTSTLMFSLFFLHSIRTRIKTFSGSHRMQTYYRSFFIPLEQGLKQVAKLRVKARGWFFLHSIRTRIKTESPQIPLVQFFLFFLHSIRTRIKTVAKIAMIAIMMVLSSFH